MSDDLDALWAAAKPIPKATGAEDLDALWEQAAPRKLVPGKDVPRVSKARTVADSAADWATAGNQDEMGGFYQSQLARLANATPEFLRPLADKLGIETRYKMDPKEVYREGRDENRMLRELGREQNPTESKIGAALGLGAGLLALPAGGPSTLGMLGTGAAYGALAGAGRDDADLLDGEWEKFAGNIGTGAALGAGTAGLLKGAGAGLGRLGRGLRSVAERRAYKAAGPMLKDFRKLGSVERAEEVGRALLDEGAVKFGRSTEGVAKAIEPLRREAGEAIGKSVDDLDRAAGGGALGVIDRGQLTDYLRQTVLAPLKKSSATRDLAAKMSDEIDAIAAHAEGTPMTLAESEALKMSYEPLARFDQATPGRVTEAFKSLYGALKRFNEQHAEKVSPELAKKFLGAKRRFSNLKPAERAAEDYTKRQQANRLLSPSDYGSGLTGALLGGIATGGPGLGAALTGAAMAAGNRLVRTRGNSSAAVAADALSKALLAKPGALRQAVSQIPGRLPELSTVSVRGLMPGIPEELAPLLADMSDEELEQLLVAASRPTR